ncbi:glycosyltransferase family 2 protein [Natronococcus pandeyae]|uniref:Glycosyltransferase family 2 protein n=1 Tax=Natronococcus pandeyae TaxID=2055836 RepID=A0A8J8TSU8_9EURY|nr:glycosyltransferase family 2 protein [Natronococcus pandeyae]TYL38962.1 glycosyltransferase family 2 protein [Natronococcus pandeyae]
MYRGHTIGVVVPAYNEAEFVGDVIETVPSYVDRVYVVDDRSTDDTWTEITRHAARVNNEARATVRERDALVANGGSTFDRRVVPIRHAENRGVGGAIKTGYLRALEDAIDATAVMAGDGQMDPEQLPSLLDPIVADEADYAKGNRLVSDDYRRGMPRFRLFGNALLTFLTKVASGYWRTMDPQNGYTAISADALEAIDVESMYEDYGYPNDLLVRLNTNELRVADVAMPAVYGDEESNIDYTTYVPKVSVLLVRTFAWRLGRRYPIGDAHPVPLFYAAGALAAGGGFLGALRSVFRQRRRSDDRGLVGLAVSGLLLAAGAVFLSLAARLELRVSEELEVQRHG